MTLAGSGCGTLTNLESPRTLAPGRWTVELEGRAIHTRSEVGSDGQTPHAVSVHAGIRDGFELGARGGFARPELLAKWRLSSRTTSTRCDLERACYSRSP